MVAATQKAAPASARRLVAFLFSALLCVAAFGVAPRVHGKEPRSAPPILVDTDAGADDLMALAFLLSRPDVRVEAITVANGVAHVPAGGRNILRLLALARRDGIPVYLGRETPLAGNAEFPTEWRKAADELSGVALPQASHQPQTESAAKFLARRLSDRAHPVRILALGPLTNLAEALDSVPPASRTQTEIVIMGGAFGVRGNLGDGGALHTNNTTAEWNFFVDPVAAGKVLAAGGVKNFTVRLVPLDATNQVPIDSAFLDRLTASAHTELAKSVAQILRTNQELISQGLYSAWDPLAAVAMVNPSVVQTRCIAVAMRTNAPEAGRTVEKPDERANVCVAFSADRERFYKAFLGALEPAAETKAKH